MNIRNFRSSDIQELERIHQQYKDEFPLDVFEDRNFIGMFTAHEDNKPIIIGGVRTLTEMVIVTDKEASVRERREALYKSLDVATYLCNTNNYPELHSFVQDDIYMRVLLRRGFKIAKGTALVIPTI